MWPFRTQPRPSSERSVSSDWSRWWDTVLESNRTASGRIVTPDTSLRCSVVYACVRVLAETIASLPIMVYRRRPDGGKDIAADDYRYALLHDAPNPMQTAFEWKECLVGHVNLRGNHISYIQRALNGKVRALIPLDPTAFRSVDIDRSDNRVRYVYAPADKKEEYFFREDLVHIKLFSEDGIWGLSPIEAARDSIGLALGQEEYAAKYFANNARPGGILRYPGRLTPDAATRLKKSWEEAHAGSGNAHKTVVLEDGLEWQSIGLSNEDSQFLESRSFQVEEIARIFRVPSVLIGHPDKTMTYASSEQFFLSFVTHTIRPWVIRIEQVLNLALFANDPAHFCEFKLDALLRGDTDTRYRAYSMALQNKWMTRNEIRQLENLNPVEGGDVFENPAITPGEGRGEDIEDE